MSAFHCGDRRLTWLLPLRALFYKIPRDGGLDWFFAEGKAKILPLLGRENGSTHQVRMAHQKAKGFVRNCIERNLCRSGRQFEPTKLPPIRYLDGAHKSYRASTLLPTNQTGPKFVKDISDLYKEGRESPQELVAERPWATDHNIQISSKKLKRKIGFFSFFRFSIICVGKTGCTGRQDQARQQRSPY